MNRKEINELLSSIGWTKFYLEPDTAQQIRLGEKVVTVVVINNTFSVSFDPMLSTDIFDKFVHIIGAYDVDHYTGKVKRYRYALGSTLCETQVRLNKQDYDARDMLEMSNQVLKWAASVDVEAGLAELRALPTDCLGALPVHHFAALAVAGDVDTLGRYRDNFAAGERMDFVPYIDEGYIARALELAEKRKADPNWIPDKPKMRV